MYGCKELDGLVNSAILEFPNFKETFIVTTDTSDFAVGAVLSQGDIPNDRPIHFFSKILNQAQRNYSTIEKEAYSVVLAVTSAFRHYLWGQKEFILYTDHKPLSHFQPQKYMFKTIQMETSSFRIQIQGTISMRSTERSS